MKTNLFKRTLSFVIVACMLIAMVAVAPMASAAVTPLTFGMDVYEYSETEVRVSVYVEGYDAWDFNEAGIDNIQFQINFPTDKLTFKTSISGAAPYKAFTAPTGMTLTCSGSTTAAAANNNGYVVFLADAGIGEDEETGDPVALYIPQGEKVYLRTYRFDYKEGANLENIEFTFDTNQVFITDYFHGVTKIVNGKAPEGWVFNNYAPNAGKPEGPAPEIEFAGFYQMIGAQARPATEGKAAGMRFGVNLDDIVPGVEFEAKGIIMLPTDLLNGEELTHKTANYVEGTFDAKVLDPNDNSEIYTAVLVGIPEGQEARPITARGFVKINGYYYYTAAMERNYKNVLDQLAAMQ